MPDSTPAKPVVIQMPLTGLNDQAQTIMAVAHYVKDNFVDPFLEIQRQEVEERRDAGDREAKIVAVQLERQHDLNKRILWVAAGMMLLVLGGGLALFILGRTTEGMVLLTSVACAGGGGGVVFALQRSRKDE